jgi:2,4-diaminopentanoate dehydrogenase C-terminal domain/alpha/beta hydrolase fold
VITTAEEAAYPWAIDAATADRLDALARSRGVTILGAGLNPGLAFDALVLTACSVVPEVDSLLVERVVDVSGFGETVLRRIGIAHSPESFEESRRTGAVTGHIGFPHSMRVVAGRLGVEIERIDRELELIWPPSGIPRSRRRGEPSTSRRSRSSAPWMTSPRSESGCWTVPAARSACASTIRTERRRGPRSCTSTAAAGSSAASTPTIRSAAQSPPGRHASSSRSTTASRYWEQYLDGADGTRPEASPLRAVNLRGVAPALVQTTEHDPLCHEGEEYARLLEDADVPVTLTRYARSTASSVSARSAGAQ